MSFSFFLALKYLKPKRSVASVITCVSVIGVMLGVAVVIVVRSVMTGFGDIWEEKILDFKPHVSLLPADGNVIHGEDGLAERLRTVPGVTCVTPEIDTRVLLSHKGRVLAPVIIGVDGDDFTRAYKIGAPRAGTFKLDGDSIVLGSAAARTLGVWVGDEVVVYSPKTLVARDEVFLPVKWKVSGIFSCGQHEYDSGYVVASLSNVRDLMGMERGVFAIHVKTDRPTDQAGFERIVEACRAVPRELPGAPPLRAITWREADREIFNALAVEKNMTALLLSLISLVAVFCVMNTLLVLTVQKTPEIGLLKAVGFGRLEIMNVFVVHGMIQCGAGVLLGLAASWAVLANLQNIVEWLATVGVEVFPASVYGLAAIPHRLIVSDIFWVVGLVFVFGLLASLIPALFASFKDPVKALNS
ncbi:MAG: ABC transporter permease [Kiritimatiellae bacterium]|nr:ABC transporter permease [Kiritimatiellia bacterium]